MNFRRSQTVTLTTALALVLSAGMAAAQMGNAPSQSQRVELDPISMRGPNPSEQFTDIKIEQKLDAQVPLDLTFKNEQGETVQLSDYFDGRKPVLLNLVYYECPQLCGEIMNDVAAVVSAEANDFEVGEDYDVISVSIDHEETPELATEKKKNYVALTGRDGATTGWHFLTGDEDNIRTLANAVGYRYAYDPKIDEYAHASGIMFLTPSGVVSSYLLGLKYLPRQVELALTDAGEGKVGSLVDQLVLLCYAYDPASGTYGWYIVGTMRVIGTVLVIMLALYIGISLWREHRQNRESGPDAAGGSRPPTDSQDTGAVPHPHGS